MWPFWRVLALAVAVCVTAAVLGSAVVLWRGVHQPTEWVPPERGVIRER